SATHPTRCAFIQSQSAPPPSLQDLLDVEACAADREELNALYVAITRAKTRLYISRVEPHYQSSKPSWWNRLLSSGALNGEAPWVWTDSTRSQDEWAPQTERIILQELPALPEWTGKATSAEPKDSIQLLGQTVHKALEWITAMPLHKRTGALIERAVKRAVQLHELPVEWHERALHQVQQLLDAPEIAPWLAPDHHLWSGNEVTLHLEGQTLRIDRLVARLEGDRTCWWILDYKLNHNPQELETYRAQMKSYMRAVALQQPQDLVRAAFISGAGRLIQLDDPI
ncbi:MAG TPA: PD-(D/E)XK nuclease family protein, partial [Aquabacterium sp.]|nr:PD-(D/E)XK nuclease family protein [Aquabacterium sp.]